MPIIGAGFSNQPLAFSISKTSYAFSIQPLTESFAQNELYSFNAEILHYQDPFPFPFTFKTEHRAGQ